WVKTSLAPGSKVVTDYFTKSGVLPDLERLGFGVVGYGCTTCIGNSGPLPEPVSKAIDEGQLVVAAVLSGNRNFEGRVNALAGRMDIDLEREPLGLGTDGPVFLRDIWPSPKDVEDEILRSVKREMFQAQYANVFAGDEQWRSLPAPAGDRYAWSADSTYVKNPPYFDG
ncbi:MAG: aconitase family protein, partial [Gammaproteobacteria bacterium]|nr:aconitase family protein [Gammaproteobacteria bacterium]